MTYYERKLPHWQPEGKALFVTWQLHGSLPKSVRIARDEMASGKAFVEFDRELDRVAEGPVWLKDTRIAQCVVDALHFGDANLGLYTLVAYVVLVNHVHVLLQPKAPLPKISRAIKGYTPRRANEILGRTGSFWQDESYDRWVRSEEELQRIIRYIESNPVSARLVERIEDWPWSSARRADRQECLSLPIVKICGITNREDALAAIEAGARALGFNFYPESPRYIAPEAAAELVASLPAPVWKVGVFVNERCERVADLARRLALDVVQLHGEEPPEEYPEGLRVWKAARVDEHFAISDWNECPAEAVLLDGSRGGGGKSFDWSLAAGSKKKIVIAGGLDADNVRQAIQQARPWGVDACSRIESSPGKKDRAKMIGFIQAALSAA
jgi:phosphoribosylanthranilate isomerase/REP element-mobilizing transposase RayT